jgi:NAD(P)H-hydrate epimerase
MRVLTAEQMQKVDAETIDRVVPGLELMERAGRGVARMILTRYGAAAGADEEPARRAAHPRHAAIFVGSGNNGGDGLVVARHLIEAGWSCSIHLLKPGRECTPDTAKNYQRLVEMPRVRDTRVGSLRELDATRPDWVEQATDDLRDATVLVDSIFGTGFSGAPRDRGAEMIALINSAASARHLPVVSIDIPSGVNGTTGEVAGEAVRATLTFTIGAVKTGLLFHPGRAHVGELAVIDIGFPPEIVEKHAGLVFHLDEEAAASKLPRRAPDIHKYGAGTALVVAGSERYRGAAMLAAEAALRGGCGMVYLAVPEGIQAEVSMGLREAIVVPLPRTGDGTIAPAAAQTLASYVEKADAIAVGPGLGRNDETDAFVRDFLRTCPKAIVIDADGLTAFAGHAAEFARAKSPVVITPHDGELARLTGEEIPTAPVERLAYSARTARDLRVTLVHKGAPTLVAGQSGEVWINASGTSALAKGGTGDVLTGLVVSLVAQSAARSRREAGAAAGGSAPERNAQALDAACVACFLHGRAGEIVAGTRGVRGVIAGDLLGALGPAMVALEAAAGAP